MKTSKAAIFLALILPGSAFSSSAPATEDLKPRKFMECAATFSYYTYLLKSIDYSNKEEIAALEEKIASYLGIALEVAGSDTRSEYKEILTAEQNESEKIIQSKGVNEYLRYTSDRIAACGEYAQKNKDKILKILSGNH